ncbi:methyltransferase domain-containing protein [Microlunatus sp. GCM10028923]|uniref:methyltransferase domain-containing protein n=1 Tax=Microlunatus sp. GCM10028923 TaxID=3273400 RepID=UPI00360F42AF
MSRRSRTLRTLLGGVRRRMVRDRTVAGHPADRALVETFTRQEVAGWLLVPPDTPACRVSLCLNDVAATEVVAHPEPGPADGLQRRRFRFVLYDFWRFARTTDTVSVRYGERPILLSVRNSYGYHPKTDGLSTPEELITLLRSGHIFGQGGKIQLGKVIDTGWQDQVLRLHAAVHRQLEAEFGLRTFLGYGTLLGHVRDHGFIDHDRDFDCAYLARHPDPAAAAQQLITIAESLVRKGFQVIPKASCLAIKDVDSGTAQIDLFHLVGRPDGSVGFPFGSVGSAPLPVSAIEPLQPATLAGRPVLVPAVPAAVVEHLYGPGWRVPDPGFSWLTARTTRESRALLDHDQQDRLYWTDFYARPDPLPPSPFARWVLDHPDLPGRAVDLGCGDGRDSGLLAAGGRSVLGIDRIPAAVALARGRTEEAAADFAEADLNDAGALTALLRQARGESDAPLLHYARGLAGTLTEPDWLTLLDRLAGSGRPGDVLALELRTDADRNRPKANFRSVRRFPPPDQMISQLADRGWTVLDREEGTGLSPYRTEDPALLRLLARLSTRRQ